MAVEEPGADVAAIVAALDSQPAPAEPAAQTDEPDPVAAEPEPIVLAEPDALVVDSVLDAHKRRQQEGVAEYLKEKDEEDAKRAAVLDKFNDIDAANRKLWAEAAEKQAREDAALEAAEIRKQIVGLKAQIKDLEARAKQLDKTAAGKE